MREKTIDWIARIAIPLVIAGGAWIAWFWIANITPHWGSYSVRSVACPGFLIVVLVIVTQTYVEAYWLRPWRERRGGDDSGA